MEDAPHSSLVRMFDLLDQDGEWLIDSDGKLLSEKFSPNGAAAVLGTSLALLRFCEESNPVKLLEGSWIFETGGSKGLHKNHTPAEVRQRLSNHFSLPQSRILNEYGMTELFSQFYQWGNAAAHQGPPWTAIRVVDVFSGILRLKARSGIWKSSILRISTPSPPSAPRIWRSQQVNGVLC